MSSYEDYTRVSRNYDKTRGPVGIEVIIGCMAQARTPLEEMVVLDAGCGTGNYSRALLEHVGKIIAVDLNEDMIGVAKGKLARAHDNGQISFHVSRIGELPFEDASFDGVMVNQVLHHLPDEPAKGFPVHRRVFRELARVLKPGGILTVNTCSRKQLEHGYWYYNLIPQAAKTLRNRFVPIELLLQIFEESGFVYRGRFAPLDVPMQGPSYFDPQGPLRKEWRDGDSTWSLTTADELEQALQRIRELDEGGELEEYVVRNDAWREDLGQASILYASRR